MRKMLWRAHVLSKLNLGMKEKVYLLKAWVLMCVFLAACAYYRDSRVIAELRKVYQMALSLSSWGMTLGVALKQPPQPLPKGEERWDLEDTWLKGWHKL